MVDLIPNTEYNVSVQAHNEFTTTDQIGLRGNSETISLPPPPNSLGKTVIQN